MKLGIVTLYGDFNYGNRLQNYALSTVLRGMGHDVVTLVTVQKTSAIKGFYRKHFEKEGGKIRLKTRKELNRDAAFSEFTSRNIPTRFIKSERGLSGSLNEEFDSFVVGSDQVWNPLWWGDDLDCCYSNDYLLRFADADKRVAYSASFGLDSVPDMWKALFKDELGKYRAISVREEAGASIVADMVGSKPAVTLDPTMLLDAEEWREVEADVRPSGKYVFQFNLGERSDEQIELARQLASRGYEIIDYMDPQCRYFGGDPSEFLSLLDGAACVLTDSFHASVFSILFRRPFAVFGRKHANGSNMNSRINTLLGTFGFEGRWCLEGADAAFSCDFSGVDAALDAYRRLSLDYLNKALVR